MIKNMNSSDSVKVYYDNFKTKLINDFLKPNRRISNAIERSIFRIPCETMNILDLGFGLGWSSYEFARHFPKARVEAYDISEELYRTASLIFQQPNLRYYNLDLTKHFPKGKYNVVVLLDVFEHISRSDRPAFYENIADCLSANGRIILTCPTVHHQEYLRRNNPKGLQPVDEDVDLKVLLEFAHAIGGEISYFEYLNVWDHRDYLIAEIKLDDGPKSGYLSYLFKAKLIGFFEKYRLFEKHNDLRQFLPPLTFIQRLCLRLKNAAAL